MTGGKNIVSDVTNIQSVVSGERGSSGHQGELRLEGRDGG